MKCFFVKLTAVFLTTSTLFTSASAQEKGAEKCSKENSAECLVMFDKSMKNKSMSEAISWLEKGCDYDNSRACLKLGSYYEKLNNKEKSVEFYRKSCKLEAKVKCPNAERLLNP